MTRVAFNIMPSQAGDIVAHSSIALVAFVCLTGWAIYRAVYLLYWHPLARFPGPRIAALTDLYKAYIECFSEGGTLETMLEHHARYGDVVRIGPNELSFSNPATYFEIYSYNQWEKEKNLYHSFNEDMSSFGFLGYREAKERRDVVTRAFSRMRVLNSQELIVEKIMKLCKSIEQSPDHIVNLFFAFRSFTLDIITYISFGTSVGALNVPNYESPILMAMDACLPSFSLIKYFSLWKHLVFKCPPSLSKIISPLTAELVNLQLMLQAQIDLITRDHDQLSKFKQQTIYHELLRPGAHKSGRVPSAKSIYHEAQALVFAGSDTVGAALMAGTFHILQHPNIYQRLKEEIQSVWPNLEAIPDLLILEKLPYLTAVIKEILRTSPGVVSRLLRVVPPSGATISGRFVPGGTVVGMSAEYVHRSEDIFERANEFVPERWLGQGPQLDKWICSFSHGGRDCIGRNLAWAELYLCIAHIFRKFDLEIDPSSPSEIKYRDRFLPEFIGPRFRAKMTPVLN